MPQLTRGMFAFMIRRATAPGGAEKEETAPHVLPIHAAHTKAGHLLNGTTLVSEFQSPVSVQVQECCLEGQVCV